jgi:hypothetical protein
MTIEKLEYELRGTTVLPPGDYLARHGKHGIEVLAYDSKQKPFVAKFSIVSVRELRQ